MGNPDPLHSPFLSAGLAILVAALLNLDRRAFAQTGLNRPLVAGVIVGFATGDPRTGLALGIWTELLWLWRLTVGGELTPNGCAALSSVLIALNLARVLAPDLSRGLPLSPLAFFLVPVIAHLAVLPETRARKYSSRILALLNRKLKAAAESRALPVTGDASLPRLSPEPDGRPETRPAPPPAPPSFFLWNLTGLLYSFLASAAFVAVFSFLSLPLFLLAAEFLPPAFFVPLGKFEFFAPAAALIGVAASLTLPALKIFSLGFILGTVAVAIISLLGI